MRKKENKIIISALLGILAFYFIYALDYYAPLSLNLPISNEGFVKVSVQLGGTALQFSSDCFTVTMNIHEVQALSIANGVAKRIDVRPLTHDMLSEILKSFSIKMLQARIESFEKDIYYAKTFVQQGNKILDIDTRPSDAVGIAVRTNAPIYFNKQLLESKGVNTCK